MNQYLQGAGSAHDGVVVSNQSMTQVAQSRAEHEVQAAYVIAKKFPRNENQAIANIMNACKRHSLAEKALYAYPRGSEMVTGPSIRLAEVLARYWGNVDCGVREISQANGVSVAEAYAIDLETNTRMTKIFHVEHKRYSKKKGFTKLTDPRDIYELVANNGSRRLRACILGVIPGDIVEDAVLQVGKTLESSDVPIKEQIKKMVLAFDEFGVKVEHLEKRLGHNLDSTIPAEIVTLKSIYRSIKDGMATRESFFDISGPTSKDSESISELKAAKGKPQISQVDKETGEVKPDTVKAPQSDNKK